jgi:hypothetical protein
MMKISHLSWNFSSLKNQLIRAEVIYFANESHFNYYVPYQNHIEVL